MDILFRRRPLPGTPRFHWITVIFLLLVSLSSGCSTAPVKPDPIVSGDYEYTKQYISWFIEQEMRKKEIAGISVALVDDQRIVWAAGFGYADKANNIAATPETVYAVGSISKLFTATAAMQLAEQGRMDIDRPLQAYVPEFSIKNRFPEAGPITPRNIMSHHSGLPSDLKKGMWVKKPEPFTSVAARIKDEYVAFPSDLVFSYSNLGLTLLGHAIQNVSGRDFDAHLEESLLRPLNMTLSGFSLRSEMLPLLSKGYQGGRENEAAQVPDRDRPAGALRSTVLDLSRFMQMVFADGMAGDRRIARSETVAEMLRPQNAGVLLDLDTRVGLGWMLGDGEGIGMDGAGRVASHAGGVPSFYSQLMVLLDQKLGVVVLSNSESARDVVPRIAVHALKNAYEAKTGIKPKEMKKPVAVNRAMTQEELQTYAGWYSTIAGPVHVTVDSGNLRADVMHKTMRLVPLEDGGMGLKYKLLGLIPVSLGDLEYLSLSRVTLAKHEIIKARSIGGKEFLAGEKIQPVPVPDQWLRRVGEYELVNPGDDLFVPVSPLLQYKDGILFLKSYIFAPDRLTFMFPLSPLSGDEAVIFGLGRGMGETVRAETREGRELLYYSGYVFRKKI